MCVKTFRKSLGGITYSATIERQNDGTQKIRFCIDVDSCEPIPVSEWSTIGALCELFRKEISDI